MNEINAVKTTILVVDDEKPIRTLLRRTLEGEGYQCLEAGNAQKALEILAANPVALVLLDINMPGKSGAELLPQIRATYPHTAIIMATAISDTSLAVQCMKQGAYDYVTKPFNLEEVATNVGHALEKRRLELENKAYQQHLEEMVAERTAELRRAIEKIKLASLDTIHRLARAAECRDEGTGTHIKRIGQYSANIAHKMGLSDSEVENILYAAPMHDIGKIGIPDHILLKPGKLEPKEWEIMKEHTTIGAAILRGSDAEFIRLAELVALTHHEKWDGSGYPKGLRGAEIPLAGRIVAIADVFDALTSKRPYKDAYSIEESFKIIRESSGAHFDPDVVDAFVDSECEIITIRRKYKDEEESKLASLYLGKA